MPIPSLFEPSSSYEETDLNQLFFRIFRAQTEEELHTIIEGNPLLSNPQHWFPLGGNENNFAIVQNQ